MTEKNTQLPGYAQTEIKQALLENGASGTIYALVMPESEAALAHVLDGGDRSQILKDAKADWLKEYGSLDIELDDGTDFVDFQNARLDAIRDANYFSMYREPWTQKQDAMHQRYFDTWIKWSSPVVHLPADDFSYRFPTAGASEGTYKVMAEFSAHKSAENKKHKIHVFEGEYEGFKAYAEALKIPLVIHDRAEWESVAEKIGPNDQFWISQPSAIDGNVWPHFEELTQAILDAQPKAQVVPDLTYVGNVAHEFSVNVDFPNIRSIIMSQSKPCGGYYHRIGGVLSRDPSGSLFGNVWFKNLQSLAWATEMMNRHGVYDLPRKYAPIQADASKRIAKLLGIENFRPADVFVLGTAPVPEEPLNDINSSLLRGPESQCIIRVCLTPTMTSLIDPHMAPETFPRLMQKWEENQFQPEDTRGFDL